jgi:hypothetical protein
MTYAISSRYKTAIFKIALSRLSYFYVADKKGAILPLKAMQRCISRAILNFSVFENGVEDHAHDHHEDCHHAQYDNHLRNSRLIVAGTEIRRDYARKL